MVIRESDGCQYELDSPDSPRIIPLDPEETASVLLQTNLPSRHTEENYYVQFTGVIFYLYDNPD
jgi:hypothetical protein